MAAINPGSGGTLRSSTVEGIIQEACTFLRINELDPSKNPGVVLNIIGTHSQGQQRYSCSFSLPLQIVTNASGNIEYAVPEYLTNLGFVPGAGGTFKSSTCAGVLAEAIVYAEQLEADINKNPDKLNYISGRLNIDTRLFTGTIELPVTMSIGTTGEIFYTVQPYLLT